MPTFKIPAMNSKSSNTQRKSRLSRVGGDSSSSMPIPCPEPLSTGNSSATNKSQSVENPTNGSMQGKSVCVQTPTRSFEPENAQSSEGDKGDDKEELIKAVAFAHAARQNACSNLFWEEREIYFAPITPEHLLLLNQSRFSSAESVSTAIGKPPGTVPSLIQRALSALITEDDIEQWEENQFEGREEVNLQAEDNGVSESQASSVPENEYQMLSPEDKLLLEFQSLDLNVEKLPRSEEKERPIHSEIEELQEKLHYQGWKIKEKIEKIKKGIEEKYDSEKRTDLEAPFEKLIEIANQKMLQADPKSKKDRTSKKKKKSRTSKKKKTARTSNGPCTKENLAFIERTLKRCKDFEETGRSCFNGINLPSPSRKRDKENMEINQDIIGCSIPPSTSVSGTKKRKRCIDKPSSGVILRPRKKKEKVAAAVIINVEEEEEKGGGGGGGGEKA